VVENANHLPEVRVEPAGDVIEKIRGDLLAFDLQPGAMREEAQLVAEMLNRHIASISLTIFPRSSHLRFCVSASKGRPE